MIRRVLTDLRDALMLLTRLPVWPVRESRPPDLSRSVWAYPLVGSIVGLIGAAVYFGGGMLGLPSMMASVLALAATVLATGAFHEDGLADTADGLGGGATPAQKLEIMRDSRLGTFGVMSLILSQLIRIVGLSVLSPTVGAAALVTLHCLSRGAIVAMLAGLGPARREGMGAVAGQPWPLVVVLGLVLAVSPLLAWPPLIGIRLLLAATIGTLLVWRLARRHLGGYTGDILGTSQQISECACWIALAGVFR